MRTWTGGRAVAGVKERPRDALLHIDIVHSCREEKKPCVMLSALSTLATLVALLPLSRWRISHFANSIHFHYSHQTQQHSMSIDSVKPLESHSCQPMWTLNTTTSNCWLVAQRGECCLGNNHPLLTTIMEIDCSRKTVQTSPFCFVPLYVAIPSSLLSAILKLFPSSCNVPFALFTARHPQLYRKIPE